MLFPPRAVCHHLTCSTRNPDCVLALLYAFFDSATMSEKEPLEVKAAITGSQIGKLLLLSRRKWPPGQAPPVKKKVTKKESEKKTSAKVDSKEEAATPPKEPLAEETSKEAESNAGDDKKTKKDPAEALLSADQCRPLTKWHFGIAYQLAWLCLPEISASFLLLQA
jgi:hypothetical protein